MAHSCIVNDKHGGNGDRTLSQYGIQVFRSYGVTTANVAKGTVRFAQLGTERIRRWMIAWQLLFWQCYGRPIFWRFGEHGCLIGSQTNKQNWDLVSILDLGSRGSGKVCSVEDVWWIWIWELRFSRRWLWGILYSGLWYCVVLHGVTSRRGRIPLITVTFLGPWF